MLAAIRQHEYRAVKQNNELSGVKTFENESEHKENNDNTMTISLPSSINGKRYWLIVCWRLVITVICFYK